jgi:hypothetical protein
MAVVRVVKHVNAAPAVVFAVAADLEHWPDFIRGVQRIDRLEPHADGPLRAGMRFRETRTMFGRESTEEFQVTACDAPHRFSLEAKSCGVLFASEHRFIPDIAGTLVELTLTTKPISLMAKLMKPLSGLMLGPMKKCVEADLDDLKAVAEQRAAADWQIDPDAALHGYQSSTV